MLHWGKWHVLSCKAFKQTFVNTSGGCYYWYVSPHEEIEYRLSVLHYTLDWFSKCLDLWCVDRLSDLSLDWLISNGRSLLRNAVTSFCRRIWGYQKWVDTSGVNRICVKSLAPCPNCMFFWLRKIVDS